MNAYLRRVGLLLALFIVGSCSDNMVENSENSSLIEKNDGEVDLNSLKSEFSFALARVLNESEGVRKLIKEEAIKQFDHDYDVLYMLVKDKQLGGGGTLEGFLLKYVSRENLLSLYKEMPTLTIFVPSLPGDSFSAEGWNTAKEIPYVAYKNKENEINTDIERIERELKIFNFDNELKEYSNNELKIFKDKLSKKYSKNLSRQVFTEEDLWKRFDKVINEYPVILSTTHSLRNCIPDNLLINYLIVDEASQVDILTGSLALSCAKNVVIVGDLMQLTNVVSEEDREVSKKIFDTYKLKEAYDFSNNNLLSSITSLNKDIKKTLLKEHYRCHPKIINFCNKEFYNDELIILTEEKEGDSPLVLYKTKEGNHARGTINIRQIDVIKEEVLPKLKYEKSIAVISPYRKQTEELSRIIGDTVEADTVHKFQGREKDVVILSTVSNEINDFVDNSNLINVAISRAVKKLIVVTSDFENVDSNIGDLIKYIQYNNLEVVESEVSSIFDLLYKSYGEKLVETIKSSKKVSNFDSENLMYALIEEILSKSEFSNLSAAIHVPLKMIIRNTEKLTAEERKFVLNPWTHTDFLVFSKLDKKPVLVVEVDGYKYHVQNPKQLERDKRKDKILEKYNVPIIRFSTTGSGEKKLLEDKLRKVI